ncbi:hypothetical protein T265_15509, partial [Opisthorchis viverrini]
KSGRQNGDDERATNSNGRNFRPRGKHFVPQSRKARANRVPTERKNLASEKHSQKPRRQEPDDIAPEAPSEPRTQTRRTTIKSSNHPGHSPFGFSPSEEAEAVLKCLYTNCLSLFNKLGDVRQSACLEKPSIIALTETWLTPDVSDAEISIDGYFIFRADSKRGRAGGVALYLHAALPIPIVLADTTPAPFCDALWVQIPLRGSDSLLLGVVYRSPSSPPEDDQFLTQTLEQLSSKYHFTHLLLSFNRALELNMSIDPPDTAQANYHPFWIWSSPTKDTSLISVYETPTHFYLVGSDLAEEQFRVLKIARAPVPLVALESDTTATIEAESLFDRLWRLSITTDTHIYTKSDVARLLHIIQAASRRPQTGFKRDDLRSVEAGSGKWPRLGGLFRRKPPSTSPTIVDPSASKITAIDPSSLSSTHNPREMQQSVASGLISGTAERSLFLSTKCHGIAGVIRFLRGYYLILITKCRIVAQMGEHKIFKIYFADIASLLSFLTKVEDTSLIYIPGNDFVSDASSSHTASSTARSRTASVISQDDLSNLSSVSPLESSRRFLQQYNQATNSNRLMTDEMRYLKLFNSVDLADNFYFSHTYDLSHALQYNLKPVFNDQTPGSGADVWAVKPMPNDRFVWNWRLIPPRFRPDHSSQEDLQPDWFTLLYHGTVSQAALAACGTPLYITLIGRRSRHFAGPRFLKRGSNLVGDVANEVETEQIVTDTSHALLRNSRCSSYVQLRGSVPLFWSQEPTKLGMGRPPIELLREDPYFEAFGAHFANLLERHGSPIVVFNLMKRREKRKFEHSLSEGFERGLAYLSQGRIQTRLSPNWNVPPSYNANPKRQFSPLPTIQFLPSRVPLITSTTASSAQTGTEQANPPILYIAFDIARVQKHKSLVALEELRPVVESCVKRTGIFLSSSGHRWAESGKSSELRQAVNTYLRCVDTNNRQCGLIRVNCVDCLDRTNTAQFVIGRVVLAHQLYMLGFLTEPVIEADSKIEVLLQNLYDEHGDILALQYGGSQLVHNIDTYKKTRRLTSQSRDFVQTLSRYYANKFSDWDKQCATNLFLRIYRPIAWTGTLFQLACEQLYHMCAVRAHENGQSGGISTSNSTFDPNADAIFTALAAASGGPIWDVTSDSHMHWLDALSRLPVNQRPLTDWCPRQLLESLPQGLEWTKKSERLQARVLRLNPNDKRVDWFSERYQPQTYECINKAMETHVRWIELLVHPPNPDTVSSDDMGLADHDEQGYIHYVKHHSVTSDHSTPGSPFSHVRGTRSVPNLGKWYKTDRHPVGRRTSLHPTFEEDEEDLTEIVASPSPVPRAQKPTDDRKTKQTVEKVVDDEETSSDSDSADSTCSFLKVFPPMIGFTHAAHPSEAPRGAMTPSRRSASHTRASSSIVLDSYITALRSWSPLSSHFDPNAANAYVKPVDIVGYQRYVEFQCSTPVLSGVNPVSTILVPPSEASMETYRNQVKLLEGRMCSVPANSMAIYRASAMVADALHC